MTESGTELDPVVFESVVETVGVGVAIYGDDGVFRYVNETYAEMLEADRDHLVGATLWEVNPDFEADAFERYWNSFGDGQTRTARAVHEFEGTSVPVTTVTTRRNIEGTTYHFGTIRDVTELRERERELERQNERLEAFAGIVAHDLRNPLNVAQSYLELLELDTDREEAELAAGALDRMETLIDDLLTLAKQGATVDETETVALEEVAERAWGNVETAEATVAVTDPPAVEGDPGRLTQLFENLFRNALEHGGDDVAVRVGGQGEGGFYVADDGPGIPPNQRDQVFQPGVSSNEDGTGFGLSIIEEIAEAHGLTVDVTTSEDGGARFEFAPEN